ncbi:hypothetical protein Aperf_G00000025320 [Anoplocephala perfoliata]
MAIETRHYIRNRILVSVDLFGRDRLNLTAEKNWTIANIYTEVCDYIAIPESRIFGFAKKLNPETRLSALEKKSPTRHMSFLLPQNKTRYSLSKATELAENGGAGVILLYLRVRFYIPNQCLRGRVVRHLYYEQLKLNVLSYDLLCSDEIYFQLAAFSIKLRLLMQRNSKPHKLKNELNEDNLKLSDHFPQSMIENYGSDYLYDNIPRLLAPLRGQSRESVEWRFIRLASDPSSDFNLHLYPVTLSDPSHYPPPPPFSVLLSPVFNAPTVIAQASSKPLEEGHSGWELAPMASNFMRQVGLFFHSDTEITLSPRKPCVVNFRILSGIDAFICAFRSTSVLFVFILVHSSLIIHLSSGRKLTFYTGSPQEAQHLFTLSSQLHEYQTVAHLSSQQSARQLEQQDRLQYNEAYIYSVGEVVTNSRIHGNPDAPRGGKSVVETGESPPCLGNNASPLHEASDSGIGKDDQGQQQPQPQQSAYI